MLSRKRNGSAVWKRHCARERTVNISQAVVVSICDVQVVFDKILVRRWIVKDTRGSSSEMEVLWSKEYAWSWKGRESECLWTCSEGEDMWPCGNWSCLRCACSVPDKCYSTHYRQDEDCRNPFAVRLFMLKRTFSMNLCISQVVFEGSFSFEFLTAFLAPEQAKLPKKLCMVFRNKFCRSTYDAEKSATKRTDRLELIGYQTTQELAHQQS